MVLILGLGVVAIFVLIVVVGAVFVVRRGED